MDIQPLTHTNRNGDVYRRSELVLQQIKSLANESAKEFLPRAQIHDKDSPAYIQEETLVYWMRQYHRRGDAPFAGNLAEILLMRSVKHIQSKLRRLGQDIARDAEQDVLSKLFADIFDLDSDHGDFLQVRYWLVLDGMITNAFNRYVRNLKRTEYLSSPEEGAAFSSDDDVTEGVGVGEFVATDVAVEQQALIREALALVDEPYRTAFVLYHNGWPIESKDTGTITISTHFRRDPRTIRNWLRRAEQALSAWRNEERS